MKKLITVVVLLILCFSFTACEGEKEDVVTLNVFNWGEYISDGDGYWEYEDEDGNVIEIPYLDINEEFEKYYSKIHPGKQVKVNYTTYASNEEMYAKMTTSDASYDIIIPSDYLIPKLIKEKLWRIMRF